jgi:hypothetical protein
MPEEQQPESNLSPAQKRIPRRRGHRGGRGRGRGERTPRERAKEASPVGPVETSGISPAPEQVSEPVQAKREIPAPQPVQKFSASAIARAVDDVQQIVESLEQALEQMEELLKLVQTAEQQKIGDEREIESLRRALRKIQPSRNPRNEPPHEESPS